jgi:ribosomal protein S2
MNGFAQTWKLIIDKLVMENCLMFGQHPKFTSKKVAKYLLGTRETTEIFKLYELRYLLLKIYPLIHNLFYNPRVNPKLKSQDIWTPNHKQESLSLVNTEIRPASSIWPFKKRFSFVWKQRTIPPQILFASVTPNLSGIIQEAAQICNMPWHENRWLSGSITAAISYPSDKLMWQYLQDSTQEEVFQLTSQKWGTNKENEEKIKEKIKYYGRSRWPSLIVIPDISKNTMILNEARKVGLPVIGLVNSDCSFEIDYPIFAQDETLQSIYFFCHFLAVLIAKETVSIQHKRYTLQKVHKKKDLKEIEHASFLSAKDESVFWQKQKLKFQQSTTFQQIKEPWKKPFFFKVVRPWQKKFSGRYFFATDLHKYYPSFSKRYRFSKQKYKRPLYYRSIATYLKAVKHITTHKPKAEAKKWHRERDKKSWSFKRSSKNVSKRFDNSFKRLKTPKVLYLATTMGISISQHLKIRSNIIRYKSFEQKVFVNSKDKKLFQTNFQTSREMKQIRQNLRNFLWMPKMIRQLAIYRNFFPKPPRFAAATNYFWRSLQQWSQNVKWQNHRVLIKSLLNLKLRKREGIKRYKHLFYRKGYKRSTNTSTNAKNNLKKPWNSWVIKNKKRFSPRKRY